MASRIDGHQSECTLGDGDGQEGLACCDSWGHKESDTIERLNRTELIGIENKVIILSGIVKRMAVRLSRVLRNTNSHV